jgi:hypothetical protein
MVCTIPVVRLHVVLAHGLKFKQGLGRPGTQTPAWQVSPMVHAFPSLQADPLTKLAKMHLPAATRMRSGDCHHSCSAVQPHDVLHGVGVSAYKEVGDASMAVKYASPAACSYGMRNCRWV